MFVCLEEQNEENRILTLNNPDPDPQNTVTPARVLMKHQGLFRVDHF